MVAAITQQPVFDIGIERATLIAKPLKDVQRYYPIKTDGPALSILKLVGAVVAVNLPIVVTLGALAAQHRQQQKRAATPATPEVIIPGAEDANPRQYDFSASQAN